MSFWQNAAKIFADGFVLYGTGDGAEKVLAALAYYGAGGDKISAVCASEGFGGKKTFRGHNVIPVSDLKSERFSRTPVVVCFGTHLQNVIDDITLLSQSRDVYIPDVPVVAETLPPRTEDGTAGIKVFDETFIKEHQRELLKLRESLADEQSVQIFENWLKYRVDGRWQSALKLHGTDFELFDIPDKGLSKSGAGFIRSVSGGESYIDAGAYDGAGVLSFLKFTGGEFLRVVAFEPDKHSAVKLRRNLYYKLKAPECIIQEAAAWDSDGTVSFRGGAGRGSRTADSTATSALSAGGFVSSERPARLNRAYDVKTKKIDTVCEKFGIEPTFIKIDTEGAEVRVLKGAANVIKKHRPRIAAAAYHRYDDILRIPETVRELSRYKVYLRSGAGVPPWELWYYFV